LPQNLQKQTLKTQAKPHKIWPKYIVRYRAL